jgi:hypothetical protein
MYQRRCIVHSLFSNYKVGLQLDFLVNEISIMFPSLIGLDNGLCLC